MSNLSTTPSILNDSQILSDHFTFARGIIMLLLCLFGLYGNVFSVMIFTRSTMRSSINVLLSGISFIDMFLLLMCIPVFIMPVLLEYYGISFRYYNPVIMLCLYPLTLTAQTASVWTFIIISVERYLAVCLPFQLQKYVTIGRTKIVQFVVIVLSVLYNLIRFWEYRLKEGDVDYDAGEEYYETLLRLNSHYLAIYYTALYLLTHFLIPFVIILILNVCVIGAIKQSHEERRRLSSAQIQQHRTSRMIIIVTAMFALCNSLTFVLNVWESCNPDLFSTSDWSHTAFVLLDVSNILIMVNSSVNFIVYLIYCRRYRLLFYRYNRRLFLCSSPKLDTNFTSETNTFSYIKSSSHGKKSLVVTKSDDGHRLADSRNGSVVNL